MSALIGPILGWIHWVCLISISIFNWRFYPKRITIAICQRSHTSRATRG